MNDALRTLVRLPSLVALIVGASLCSPPGAAAQTMQIGVARVDVTPDYPIRLQGYAARPSESKGVQEKLWVRALAIGSDEQGPALIVTADNLGVPNEISEEVAAQLKKEMNIDRAKLAIGASHTHSAPAINGIAPNIFGRKLTADEQAHVDRYTKEFTDALVQVCIAALRDRRPATLAWSQGTVGFAINRRVVQRPGNVAFGETPKGPVDHALPMLVAKSPEGQIRAILVNYACHCTTLDPADNVINADWAGYARAAIESDHPGCTALTLVGCGGDANPRDRTGVHIATRHGRSIGDEVNRLLKLPLTQLDAPPVCKFTRRDVPFDTLPTREQLTELVKKGGYEGYNASTQLERLDRGEGLQKALDYPIQAWTFGDQLAMVFLAGEVVVDYALRLKSELDANRVWVTAYANDEPCYIPSERILKEGGYEGGDAMIYYGKPTRLKPGVEDIIINAVRELLPPQFNAPEKKAGPNAPAPMPAIDSLRAIRLPPALHAELVAAEPLITSPVAIDWAADGALFVCEMFDYPQGIAGTDKPGGRIKRLTDADHDGRYESSTIYLDSIPFPTGVMAWRKGVLVCAAPDILYAEDADGDGVAERREVLYSGFSTENYQARVNSLTYNIDNWIYGANGLFGGTIRSAKTGHAVDLGGRDFRIRPGAGLIEPASGLTQYGRARDDFGEQFGGSNSVLLQHFPFADDYARRNPRVAAPAPAVYVPRGNDTMRLYPASQTLDRYNDLQMANHVTSACSPCIYRDDWLGADYYGNAFICEPVHNLVHRLILTPESVTFSGNRAATEQRSEFLASTDNWFRPVQVRTGPDGALYVVDMYRFVIEHPRWISPQVLARLDVRAGFEKGRIYRIARDGAKTRPVPNLAAMATNDLAAALDHPNGTFRDMAQRLLVERGDQSAAPTLEKLVRTASRPAVRAQALWAIEGLGSANFQEAVRTALGDQSPLVRRLATRAAERFASDPELFAKLPIPNDDEADVRVRFQAALTLGAVSTPESARALGRILIKNLDDPWIRAAVISSAAHQPFEVLNALLDSKWPGRPDRSDALDEVFDQLLATGAGADETRLRKWTEDLLDRRARDLPAHWKTVLLAGALDALDRTPGQSQALIATRLQPYLAETRTLAIDRAASLSERLLAIRLLGRVIASSEADARQMGQLLDAGEPKQIQEAALKCLARANSAQADKSLVAAWPGLGPEMRSLVLDALLARASGRKLVLDLLEAKSLPAGEIDPSHRQQLLSWVDAGERDRAKALLGSGISASRREVVEKYQASLKGTGNREAGAVAFGRVCAGCHAFAGQGTAIGPDLAALTDTSHEAMAIAVFDPNREVDARYLNYIAALKDGRVLTGILATETANAITLKRQLGQQDVVLRGDLEGLRGSGLSLMPEGLEKDMTPAEFADVLAFLRAGAARPKTFAGNTPTLVKPGEDGVIRLAAQTAEIYGATLIYEPEFGNLGYWHSENDRAVWSFDVAKPGVYTVSLEWACDDSSAGDSLQLRLGSQAIRHVVGGTGAGTWANYKTIFAGEITLPSGQNRIDARAAGPIRSALIDLRAIVLTPRP